MALCGLTLAGFSLPAMAQVKIGDNPTKIVTGAKLQIDGDTATATPAKLIVTGTGMTGIATASPGSSLTVNGSIAGNYRIETNTAANIGATDYYVAYNGTAAGTLTLPAAISGPGNYQGRLYHIKNTSAFNITIAANGSELLDNQTGAGVASITVRPGFAILIISKGTTSGTTWEVVWAGSPTQGVEAIRLGLASSSVSNTAGSAIVSYQFTTFNTIAGATVGTNSVSLPAGMYRATLTLTGVFNQALPSNVATAFVQVNGVQYQNVGGYTTSGTNGCTFGGSCILNLASAGTVSFGYFAQVASGESFTITSGAPNSSATIERLQ